MAERRAIQELVLPPWHMEQIEDIKKIYRKAHDLSVSTGIAYHVDHIYPINPRNATDPVGLHVVANLQIISREENSHKSNMQPEEWEQRKKELRLDFPHATLYM